MGRGLAVASVALAAVALVALVMSVGNPGSWSWHQFTREGETTNQPGRLGTLGGNNRWQWWQEAAHVWRAHELAGSGAGSFEVVRKRYRENAQSVREPHNVPLQVLADLGLVGFGLFAGGGYTFLSFLKTHVDQPRISIGITDLFNSGTPTTQELVR